MTTKPDSKSERVHTVDLHVGARVRERRRALRMSQSELGVQVGLTFQQIQKYERGSNRISASKLYEIGQILHVSAAWFFAGCEGAVEDRNAPSNGELQTFLGTIEALDLGEAYLGIKSRTQRHHVLDLIRTIANTQ